MQASRVLIDIFMCSWTMDKKARKLCIWCDGGSINNRCIAEEYINNAHQVLGVLLVHATFNLMSIPIAVGFARLFHLKIPSSN